ncbi:U-box domain-containing protein [Endozoicomonas numazuensis]|uniref:U-box domain-containing protein n=1 Tax=Endozoicomonas numazuensis TaxID=1137799 RepID=A0A081NLX3_9GAMM|nr:U-box domain-containing protein [Endozoicomonas numazuensis]KEQ19446.1 hypothetical protein GZ78_05760 [Endozoicomonas numazuensis]
MHRYFLGALLLLAPLAPALAENTYILAQWTAGDHLRVCDKPAPVTLKGAELNWQKTASGVWEATTKQAGTAVLQASRYERTDCSGIRSQTGLYHLALNTEDGYLTGRIAAGSHSAIMLRLSQKERTKKTPPSRHQAFMPPLDGLGQTPTIPALLALGGAAMLFPPHPPHPPFPGLPGQSSKSQGLTYTLMALLIMVQWQLPFSGNMETPLVYVDIDSNDEPVALYRDDLQWLIQHLHDDNFLEQLAQRLDNTLWLGGSLANWFQYEKQQRKHSAMVRTRNILASMAEITQDWLADSHITKGNGDFIAEDQLARTLAGVFGWNNPVAAPGYQAPLGKRKRREEGNTAPQTTNGRDSSSTQQASHQYTLPLSYRLTAQDDGSPQNPAQPYHCHDGPSCPHPDCAPYRCDCVDCQSKRLPPHIQTDHLLNVEQVLALTSLEYIYREIGFLLGLSFHFVNQQSSAIEVYTRALNLGLLTKERLVMAVAVLQSPVQAKGIASQLRIQYKPPQPDFYSMRPNPDDKISARDAYLVLYDHSADYFKIAIELGLSLDELQDLRRSHRNDCGYSMMHSLWHAENNGLTYKRLIGSLERFKWRRNIEEIEPYLQPSDISVAGPDFECINDRHLALSQTMTLRDLVYFIPGFIPPSAIAMHFKCPALASNICENSDQFRGLLLDCLRERQTITANEVVQLLSNPNLSQLNNAHKLFSQLTGAPVPDNREVNIHKLGYVDNLEAFAIALGLPKPLIPEWLKSYSPLKTILENAFCHLRATPENLVYALEQSGNGHLVNNIEWLQNIRGVPLPEHAPLYLTDAAIQQTSIPLHSEPLSLKNMKGVELSHNWYWVGLALGVSYDTMKSIFQNNLFIGDKYFSFLNTLISLGYETAHLYEALQFLNDQVAIRTLPLHWNCSPNWPLETLSNHAEANRAFITFIISAENHAKQVAEALQIDEGTFLSLNSYHHHDSRKVIFNLFEMYKESRAASNADLIDRLIYLLSTLQLNHLKPQLYDAAGTVAAGTMARENQRKENLKLIALSILDVPNAYLCPITHDLMKEPVKVEMGDHWQYFEKEALLTWVKQHGTNPLSRQPVNWRSDVQEAPEMQAEINGWLYSQ